jgi:hypothetical protein
MQVAFSPRSGQSLHGNALVSPDGMIAHKVIILDSAICRFAPPTSGIQVLSSTGPGGAGPSTDIKAGMFEVDCADQYHDEGDEVGAFTVTSLLGMEDAIFEWASEYGGMQPDSGTESWLTVARLPDSGENLTVVTTAKLDSESRVAVTSIVTKCDSRIFSFSLSTNNVSPHLGETLGVQVTIPGCGHTRDPGWLEIEVVREVVDELQHVASVDMDPQTPGLDRYLETSALGGQSLSLEWDGIAQVGLPQADHPNIFNGPQGTIHRAMPEITSEEPVPPPFYTVRVRHWNSEKTEVLNECSETVFIPQIVKITVFSDVISLVATPLTFTNANGSATVIYAGAEGEESAEQALQALPLYVMDLIPDAVNIRFVNGQQPVSGLYTAIFLTLQHFSSDETVGLCLELDQRNSTPLGIGMVYVQSAYGHMQDYYLERAVNSDVFSIPLSVADFNRFLAQVVVHETGHALGLVDPSILEALSSSDPHNRDTAGTYIMDACVFKKMSDILSPSKTRYWKRRNRFYLEFCLPTKRWGL